VGGPIEWAGLLTETPFVPAGWFGLLHHPRFRAAVERNAAGVLAQYDRRSPTTKWLTKDLGRSQTLLRCLIIVARQGEVSLADVLARVRGGHSASESRVLRLFAAAAEAGLVTIEPPDGPWRERRITYHPAFLQLFRDRAMLEVEAAAMVAPEVRPAAAMIGRDAVFWRFLAALGHHDGLPSETRGPANPGVRLFLVHDAGLMMLYDLLLAQDPGRARLLDAAPFSRSRLARRFDVSRTHVTRLFEKAEAEGHLSFIGRDRVAFSAAMNADAERHFAVTFQTMRLAALAAMQGVAGTGAAEA
jgi:AraC-like DNA-binding protein